MSYAPFVRSFCLVGLVVYSSAGIFAGEPMPTPIRNESVVWQARENDTEQHFVYGLTLTTKGTLLAFSEARLETYHDDGPHHLVMKRSTDQGATWSPSVMIEKSDGSYWKQLGFSGRRECWTNPAAVTDRDTGRTFIFYAFSEGSINEFSTQRFTHVFYKYSDDDGMTWSERVNVTGLLNTNADGTSDKDDNGFPCDALGRAFHMPGPGHGLQLKSGRLLMQFWNRTALSSNSGARVPTADRKYGLSLLYSDDGGRTWKPGPLFGESINAMESRMVELDNGDIYLNARTSNGPNGRRGIILGSRQGLAWKVKGYDGTMPPYASCDSGLTTIRKDGRQVLLLSHGAHPQRRERLTVSASMDGGETWAMHTLLREGGANYSDMMVLPDGSVGLLYGSGVSARKPFDVNFLRFHPFNSPLTKPAETANSQKGN